MQMSPLAVIYRKGNQKAQQKLKNHTEGYKEKGYAQYAKEGRILNYPQIGIKGKMIVT